MKKQDIGIILLLFAFMMAWPIIYKKLFHPPPAPFHADKTSRVLDNPAQQTNPPVVNAATPDATEVEVYADQGDPAPEQWASISNDYMTVTVSSRGGGIVLAELKNYRSEIALDSPPFMLDFTNHPSMSYRGLPGFSAHDNFNITTHASDRSLSLSKSGGNGILLTRTISLDDNYNMRIEDVFFNSSDQLKSLPSHHVQLGYMQEAKASSQTMRQHNFGVDVMLASAGEGVKHWASKLPGMFKTIRKNNQLPRLPEIIAVTNNTPTDWIAAKDKFFVQIMGRQEKSATGYIMEAGRRLLPGEGDDPHVNPKKAEITSVSAAAILSSVNIEPQQEISRTFDFYLGPKKLSMLKKLGLHKDQIMEFGWWTPVCKILLRVLNATYNVIPNYGIAIILLTILIRIVFWPLTHKSAESMKKMQELQPEMMEIRKKHKNNPKMMQAETMALYKKNKVNPMSGCLPMLIQIPVFIALFVVLRSAIELRFADFLWIKDLSEPENLFADVLPIPLNILPFIMAITMVWQQKLMPTTDPTQQKIMAIFMPIMMLVMFYKMPSALVLYWSASQCIMIGQQLIQKKRAEMRSKAS